MNSIDRLTEIFSHFPGIGPRQARRFVYYLLSRDTSTLETLIEEIRGLKLQVRQCEECLRFFPASNSSQMQRLCNICSNTSRDRSLLMIVPRDVDLDAVEKSGTYQGLYFVLGGSLPILEKEPERRIRLRPLEARVSRDWEKLKEIILGMNANPEGENTVDFLKERIGKIAPDVTISELGRGLSTGSELEYADPETLKNALLHRTK